MSGDMSDDQSGRKPQIVPAERVSSPTTTPHHSSGGSSDHSPWWKSWPAKVVGSLGTIGLLITLVVTIVNYYDAIKHERSGDALIEEFRFDEAESEYRAGRGKTWYTARSLDRKLARIQLLTKFSDDRAQSADLYLLINGFETRQFEDRWARYMRSQESHGSDSFALWLKTMSLLATPNNARLESWLREIDTTDEPDPWLRSALLSCKVELAILEPEKLRVLLEEASVTVNAEELRSIPFISALTYGHLLVRAGNYARAAEVFSSLSDIYPTSEIVLHNLARLLQILDKHEDAHAVTLELQRHSSERFVPLTLLADYHATIGDTNQAISFYSAAIEDFPGYVDAHLNRFLCEYELALADKDKAAIQRCVKNVRSVLAHVPPSGRLKAHACYALADALSDVRVPEFSYEQSLRLYDTACFNYPEGRARIRACGDYVRTYADALCDGFLSEDAPQHLKEMVRLGVETVAKQPRNTHNIIGLFKLYLASGEVASAGEFLDAHVKFLDSNVVTEAQRLVGVARRDHQQACSEIVTQAQKDLKEKQESLIEDGHE